MFVYTRWTAYSFPYFHEGLYNFFIISLLNWCVWELPLWLFSYTLELSVRRIFYFDSWSRGNGHLSSLSFFNQHFLYFLQLAFFLGNIMHCSGKWALHRGNPVLRFFWYMFCHYHWHNCFHSTCIVFIV